MGKKDVLLVALMLCCIIQIFYNYQYIGLLNEINDESTIEGTPNARDTVRLWLHDDYVFQLRLKDSPQHVIITFIGWTYEHKPIIGITFEDEYMLYYILYTNTFTIHSNKHFEGYYNLEITAYGFDNGDFIELKRIAYNDRLFP